jgi:hypothetical protein
MQAISQVNFEMLFGTVRKKFASENGQTQDGVFPYSLVRSAHLTRTQSLIVCSARGGIERAAPGSGTSNFNALRRWLVAPDALVQ